MALSKADIKTRLGHGAVRQIATELVLSEGHVSQVINGKRADRKVARRVAQKLRVRLDELPPEMVSATSPRTAA